MSNKIKQKGGILEKLDNELREKKSTKPFFFIDIINNLTKFEKTTIITVTIALVLAVLMVPFIEYVQKDWDNSPLVMLETNDVPVNEDNTDQSETLVELEEVVVQEDIPIETVECPNDTITLTKPNGDILGCISPYSLYNTYK